MLVLAGERDTAVGSGTAQRIVRARPAPTRRCGSITDDDADEHGAPRRASGAAQRTFWAPLDALVAATRPANASAQVP